MGLWYIGVILSSSISISALTILFVPLFFVTLEGVFLYIIFNISIGDDKKKGTILYLTLITLLNYIISFVFASLGAAASIGYGIGQG